MKSIKMVQLGKNDGSGRKKTASAEADDKLDQLIEHLKALQDTNFTGHIKINFSQGGIARIEKFEELFK